MSREIKLTLIKDLGLSIRGDGRKYRMGLFLCPICSGTVEKILRDGIKAKYCGHKCYARCRERRGPYGDGTVMISGYIYEYNPSHQAATNHGYVAQHRLVAEMSIGRILLPNEVVHHINEIKTDNRTENLMVLTNSEHTKLHKQTAKRNKNGQYTI